MTLSRIKLANSIKLAVIADIATASNASIMNRLKNYLASKSMAGAIGTGAAIGGGTNIAKNLALTSALRNAAGGSDSIFIKGLDDSNMLASYLNPALKGIGNIALDNDALAAYGTMAGIGLGIGGLKGGLMGYGAKQMAKKASLTSKALRNTALGSLLGGAAYHGAAYMDDAIANQELIKFLGKPLKALGQSQMVDDAVRAINANEARIIAEAAKNKQMIIPMGAGYQDSMPLMLGMGGAYGGLNTINKHLDSSLKLKSSAGSKKRFF